MNAGKIIISGSKSALFGIGGLALGAILGIVCTSLLKKKKMGKKKTVGLIFAILTVILMMFPGFVNAYLIGGSQATGEPDRKDMVGSFGNINYATDGSIEYAYVINNQFYTDDYMDSFFFRYLGKT